MHPTIYLCKLHLKVTLRAELIHPILMAGIANSVPIAARGGRHHLISTPALQGDQHLRFLKFGELNSYSNLSKSHTMQSMPHKCCTVPHFCTWWVILRCCYIRHEIVEALALAMKHHEPLSYTKGKYCQVHKYYSWLHNASKSWFMFGELCWPNTKTWKGAEEQLN
jgi:hypothetical protein